MIPRALALPLLALALCAAFGLEGGVRAATILMSALPAVMLSLSYASQYHLDIEFTSNALFSSFFFGAITLTCAIGGVPN